MGTTKRFVAEFEDKESYERFKEIFADDGLDYDEDYFEEGEGRLEWTQDCSYGYNPIQFLQEKKAKLVVTISEYDLGREPDATETYDGR